MLEVKYLNYVPALNYENKLRVEIVGENIDVLLESDFFIEYNAGDYIDIKYANFTYMDTDFFYVASLSYQDKDYLTFEVGLNNIIALMDEHRS